MPASSNGTSVAPSPSASGSSESPSAVHLVVCCHGLWGDPSHMRYLIKSLVKKWGAEVSPGSATETGVKTKEAPKEGRGGKGSKREVLASDSLSDIDRGSTAETLESQSEHSKVIVLNTASNAWVQTYDGIDWCSERIVQEIEGETRRLADSKRKVTKLSIVGYSLGGLFARYTAGLLYSKGFFRDVQPAHFTTFSTPHIGIPRGSGWFSQVAGYIGGRLLGRTGVQLYVRDHGWHQDHSSSSSQSVPLLEAMALPGSNFHKALCAFQHVDFYFNAISDITVPIRTGGVMALDPWAGWPEGGELDVSGKGVQVERHHHYRSLLTSVKVPTEPPPAAALAKRIIRTVLPHSLPFFLDPRRIPWRFPLNYLGVALFPIVAPLFILLIITKLGTATRASNKRVRELQAYWIKEQGLSSDSQQMRYGKEHERDRISSVLRDTVQAVGEDYVESEVHESDSNGVTREYEASTPETRTTFADLEFEVTAETRGYLNSHLKPLTRIQQGMQDHLNAIPGLRKHLAFFDSVINSHAIIICRTPSMEMHRKGKEVVQHFVDHFDV